MIDKSEPARSALDRITRITTASALNLHRDRMFILGGSHRALPHTNNRAHRAASVCQLHGARFALSRAVPAGPATRGLCRRLRARVINARRGEHRSARSEPMGVRKSTVADHPYFGDKLDAYAVLSFALGQTERITGMVHSDQRAVPARRSTGPHGHVAVSAVRWPGPARDRSGSAVGHDRETRCSAAEWPIRGARDGRSDQADPGWVEGAIG